MLSSSILHWNHIYFNLQPQVLLTLVLVPIQHQHKPSFAAKPSQHLPQLSIELGPYHKIPFSLQHDGAA